MAQRAHSALPWITGSTLILGPIFSNVFGKNYRYSLYDKILDACALKPDLKILPGGDKIEIGEKVRRGLFLRESFFQTSCT